MLGNTIYIAFGSSNPTWPNKLVPFTLGGGSAAVVGTPISFVQGAMFDLASCTESAFSAITERTGPGSALVIFPSPASDEVTLIPPGGGAGTVGQVRVFDLNGRHLLPPISRSTLGQSIDVSGVADGIYMLSFTDGSGTTSTGRLVVQH